ncbi:hypothetical protein BH18ACT16_BH18ACT16_09620 [soil metagenome]
MGIAIPAVNQGRPDLQALALGGAIYRREGLGIGVALMDASLAAAEGYAAMVTDAAR